MSLPAFSHRDSAYSRTSASADFYQKHAACDDTFCDLDQQCHLQHGLEVITSCVNRNLLVEFSDRHACAGYNLQTETICNLLDAGGPNTSTTRWIDISFPSQQKDLLAKLARRYNFTPRLLAMMVSEPSGRFDMGPSRSRTAFDQGMNKTTRDAASSVLESVDSDDSDLTSLSSNNPARTGNLYELLDQVTHYASVDKGSNYLCIGFNSIYTLHNLQMPRKLSQQHLALPSCVRVWTWLILLSDRTVLTVNEDILPSSQGPYTVSERAVLLRAKQNCINVFRSLSKANNSSSISKTQLPIRSHLNPSADAAEEKAEDAPGLLFYYLFENWYNSFSLITRRDSRYGTELRNIRQSMFTRPALDQIDRLDKVSDELGVLKRHYKSYMRIIDRITDQPASGDPTMRPPAMNADLETSQISARMVNDSRGVSVTTMTALAEDEEDDNPAPSMRGTAVDVQRSSIGVSPGPAAMVRFQRLKDVIQLYALSEVTDMLEKKQDLVDMNFALISLSQSHNTELLTRVSLLLAKATVLFLPVSFTTAFFGCDLVDAHFTLAQYWITFAVVLAASVAALVGLGVLSGTMERWDFSRASVKSWVEKQRRRGQVSDGGD